jgi:hypothetical protein
MSNNALAFHQPESLADWKVAPMLSTTEDYDKLLGITTVQANMEEENGHVNHSVMLHS